MSQQKEKHLDFLHQFKKGNHVIERTNHYFAADSPDRAIEQDLVASCKSRSEISYS
jgi:hypothetical protein